MKNILIWSVLVLLNSILCFLFAIQEHKTTVAISAILLAESLFIIAYSFIGFQLLKRQKNLLYIQLIIAALIKAVTQLGFWLHVFAGLMGLGAANSLIGKHEFFSAFLGTIFTGLILSASVAFIFPIVRAVYWVYLMKIKKDV